MGYVYWLKWYQTHVYNKMHLEQNAPLDVINLASVINYSVIDFLLFVFEAMLEDIKIKPRMLINFQ